MVSSYLVYSNIFTTAMETLHYFAIRRTGVKKGKEVEGVETPSQARYVEYFSTMISQMSRTLPKPKLLKLLNIKISGLVGIGLGTGSEIQCSISDKRNPIFTLEFGKQTNCRTNYDSVADILFVDPINCRTLSGDIQIKFKCKTKSPFLFWFNTSFVVDNRLRLNRRQIDYPPRPNTWKKYKEMFAIELNFN